MLTRASLERHQVLWYLAAVAVGLLIGTWLPGAGSMAEALVWPLLAVLLYATFTQMPLGDLRSVAKDRRFLGSALIGNFVLMPLVAWGLVQLAPSEAPLRLGLLLVLLMPCTDWFITFTQLGGGDSVRALALTPVSLVLQLLLLPIYLWSFTDLEVSGVFDPAEVWPAFVVLLVPLAGAVLTRRWSRDRPRREANVDRLGLLPVPVLAAVIMLVAIAQVGEVRQSLRLLPVIAAIAIGYLLAAVLAALLIARITRLPAPQGRTLAFSFGTRNSFIVLPIALALPAGWEVAAIVIVVQSLIELLGMIVYLTAVPRLFRSASSPEAAQDG